MTRLLYPLLALTAVVGSSPFPTPVPPPRPPVEVRLRYVHVLLDGMPAEGTTVSGERGRALFQACLDGADLGQGSRAPSVLLHYDVPGVVGLSMRRTGVVPCFDDGTHGDDVAGDALYQYLDVDDEIGCGRALMPGGAYLYGFQCLSPDGRPCGQATVRVHRAQLAVLRP